MGICGRWTLGRLVGRACRTIYYDLVTAKVIRLQNRNGAVFRVMRPFVIISGIRTVL